MGVLAFRVEAGVFAVREIRGVSERGLSAESTMMMAGRLLCRLKWWGMEGMRWFFF
jgi:hypothetical protein